MAAKPVITPEAFTGAGTTRWDEWIEHFESVADVNKWDTDADKLKWLKVRLTSRAMKAFRQLPDATRADYKLAKEALKKRFEPESRKEYYIAELRTRRRRKGEDWATFGEELKLTAERAYPDLGADAREQIALTQYLSAIINPQLAFSVRQSKPKSVEAAVTTTMEMESYLGPRPVQVAMVGAASSDDVTVDDPDKVEIAAVTNRRETTTIDLLQKLTDRLDKLESKFTDGKSVNEPRQRQQRRSRPTSSVCWNCRKAGHIARNCTEPRRSQSQTNVGSGDRSTVNTVARDEEAISAVQSHTKSDCHVRGSINGTSANLLVDTGADASLLSFAVWDKLQQKPELNRDTATHKLVGVQGTPLSICGIAQVDIDLAGEKFNTQMVVVDSLTNEAILGKDFLRTNRCIIDVSRETLHFDSRGITLSLNSPPGNQQVARVTVMLDDTLEVPPRSEMEIMVSVPKAATTGTWIVEGESNAVLVARAVVSPNEQKVPVRIANVREDPINIKKGTKIAGMEIVAQEEIQRTVASIEQEKPIQEKKRQLLWDLVVRSGDSLTDSQRELLFAVLLKYEDVFASTPDDFGRTKEIRHTINVGNSPPIRQPVRRIPPIRRKEARDLLQGMLSKGVIKPSTSPWASPIVLVKKKDGSTRFCVDYRKVNNVTRKDAYPLPRVDDILDTLAGSQWFSTLDLISGYWQVEVKEEDREKTAFCTPDGLFEFEVMPFGLCNAPATFQRLMELVLAGLQWTTCLVYLDDVIVTGKTFEEHLDHLGGVLQRIRDANLKLQPTKCALCSEEVKFLGHIVSRKGVATDPAKTEKVASWPTPKNKKEVQRFLGLASYYRRFVQNFASVAKPLHQLVEKNREFRWTEQCQRAFEEIRQKLVSSPVLSFPDFSKPFVLDTDASDTGIGAVLSQTQDDGTERVIAYASRVLSKPERHYCVTRKELLAVVAFTKHFRPYLLGRAFVLRTDHGSLSWLWNFRNPEGQLARWLEQLQEYDFTIVHRRGRKHGNADAMSRIPCVQCGRESHESIVATTVQVSPLQQKSNEELRSKQLEDPIVGYLLRAREANEKPTADDLKGKSRAVKRLVQLWERLEVVDGVLWRNFKDDPGSDSRKQLIVPESLRDEVLQELHAGVLSGHLGQEKTSERLRKRFYWPGYAQDVQLWCQTCGTCASRKTTSPRNHAPLQTITAGYPMEVVAVDIVGPFPESEDGNSYVLVAGDYFSKWMEAYPIPNQEASTVARKLVNELFCRFSVPEQLHSDQGKQFESALLKEICKILNIAKTRTTAHHPQCDGLVERFNRTLLSMLSTTVADHAFDWEEALPKVCMAYNSSVHSTTGFTPFFLMYGREARLPIDIVYGTPTQGRDDDTIPSYARHTRKSLEEAYERVRTHLSAGHRVQKQHYDKRVHGDEYKEGDLVWLHSTVVPRRKSKKLHLPWTGPYRVLEKISDCNYRIGLPNSRRQPMVVHFNRLKLCPPNTRLTTTHTIADSTVTPDTQPIGTNLDLIDFENDDIPEDVVADRRYPARTRQPPERFSTVVIH